MKRAGYIVVTALAIAGLAVAFAFAYGTPQAPPSPAYVNPPSPAQAGGGAVSESPGADAGSPGGQQPAEPDPGGAPFGGEIVEGEVPEPDPQSPFAFQIPGCTCHSDDPAVVEEHAQYRLNQCRGCHAGSP